MITQSLIQEFFNSNIDSTNIKSFASNKLLVKDYLIDPYYIQSLELDNDIKETFGSVYPEFMKIQRPSQKEEQVKYRKDYFEQIGNPISGFDGQIEKQVDKIFTSEDLKIVFPEGSDEGFDGFKYYLENAYYNGVNFLEVFRETIKKNVLKSPNSLLAIVPNETTKKPYFIIVKPENVFYYKANELCIFQSELKSDVTREDGTVEKKIGDIFYFFDSKKYVCVKHVGYENGQKIYDINQLNNGSYRNHGCYYMPCTKIGRKIVEVSEDGHELRGSDLYDSMVFLRNAIMDYMDLRVELNFHIATQAYFAGTVDCGTCKGTGKVKGENRTTHTCPTCGGGKKVPAFSGDGTDKLIIPSSINELGRTEKTGNLIGGFIERSETGARLFKESFVNNLKLGLQTFGLDHLAEVPLNQSGNAKDYDMQEGYQFIMSMSDHIGWLLNFTVTAMFFAKSKDIEAKNIEKERPRVVIPKSFNLSNSTSIFNKLKDAYTFNMPSSLKDKWTLELLEKEAGVNSLNVIYQKVVTKLDPMPTSNSNTKILSRSTLSDIDYVLTNNIDSIMQEAMSMNSNFLYYDYETQKIIVTTIAQRKLGEIGENLNINEVIKPSANLVGEDQTR